MENSLIQAAAATGRGRAHKKLTRDVGMEACHFSKWLNWLSGKKDHGNKGVAVLVIKSLILCTNSANLMNFCSFGEYGNVVKIRARIVSVNKVQVTQSQRDGEWELECVQAAS